MKLSGEKLSPRYGELKTLASLINCGVLLLEDDTQLRFASPNACQLLGYDSEMAVREDWPEVVARLDLGRLQSIKQGDGPLRLRADFSRSGAVRWLRIEAYRLEQGSGGDFLVLLKDRKLLDNLSRQLLAASQMGIQAYLTSALVHDLNAPINNLQLTLELLKSSMKELGSDSLPGDAAQRLQRYQSVLKEETQRLSLLIKALPQLLSPPDSTPEKFDLRRVIEEVTGHLRHEAAVKQIRCSTMMPPCALPINGPQDHIKLALYNLAIILLEATSTGGTLLIKAESRGEFAEILLATDAARLVEETISGLDELFFSSSDHALGLHAARLVIESQSGDLTFEKGPAGQIGFRALLPLACEPSPLIRDGAKH